jgi:hypothetical protein
MTRDYVTGLNVGYLPVLFRWRCSASRKRREPVAAALLIGLLSLAGAAAILFGRRWGLLAAGLYATYPGDVFFSTVVMPDAIQAGWFSLSVLLVVYAFAGSESGLHAKLAAAGVAMGVCLLIRGTDRSWCRSACSPSRVRVEMEGDRLESRARDGLVYRRMAARPGCRGTRLSLGH